LIEVWNYHKMTLDLETIPYQAHDLYMLHNKAILSLVFSLDDKLLASGDSEGIIRVWKFQDGKKLREINIQGGEKSGVTSILFNQNNSQLIAGSLDMTIRVYGLKSGSLLKQLSGH
jgi:WD40 repeat-containing protein SMU1